MLQTEKLLAWYDEHHRDLPWRKTRNPYKIWLSEVILQQTRVEQGMPYYLRFLADFPTVQHLAKANEDHVLKLWQGLGYYSRARNMHAAAHAIVNELGGRFPDNYKDLLKLKGVGRYTAAAIASIAFNQVHPVVDGNVSRVISRWLAIVEPVNKRSGLNQIEEALENLIDPKQAGKFNQAMMEFGARYCKPKNPDCLACIFKNQCLAFQNDKVALLPYKDSKIKIRQRYFTYLFISTRQEGENYTILNKRAGKDIWQGLYEFPLIETERLLPIDDLMNHELFRYFVNGSMPLVEEVSRDYIHQLTHQRIHARFVKISIQELGYVASENFIRLPIAELGHYPLPRLLDKFLRGK